MARIEDLIDEIADPALRDQMARQVKFLKSTKRFGLVFEDHVPETVSLFGLPIRPGLIVQSRRAPEDPTRFQVVSVEADKATIVPVGLDEPQQVVEPADLLVVKAFEEPIFPGLTQVGEVRRGPADKPAHTVISGENFHALQLLAYTHASKVDVIYIDPPYNTGDKSWKYNNRFVDNNDSWRHSKWLAMMEKRLKLSRKLLKPDGVLIVTIDEHEVHHLGMLLEDLFPDARRQMVTIVNNAAGVSQGGFYRVEEYALFGFVGRATPLAGPDDFLADEGVATPIWRPLNRYSGTNVSASKRPGLVFPIYVDTTSTRLVGCGPTVAELRDAGLIPGDLDAWRPSADLAPGPPNTVALWPHKGDGSLATWELNPTTLMGLASEGYVRVVARTAQGIETQYSLSYVKAGMRARVEAGDIEILGREPSEGPWIFGRAGRKVVPKTVWRRARHDAGKWGTRTLRELLGVVSFNYAKSPYAVADTLATVLQPDGVVLDFFAGSGTTLHAVAMLNAQDDGKRQCILVTNNDVSDVEAKRLHRNGHFTGDLDFETHGIFQAVTKPRVEAALTGLRPDGKPVEGKYLEQYLPDHSYADGFAENVAFFRMDYLEPDLVELGRQFNAIAPLLWMAAGSVGSWEEWDTKTPWSLPKDSTYAVLFDPAEAAAFGSYIEDRPEITHVWIVTDSHAAYVEMRSELPAGIQVSQLYRDYLRNFTINAPGVMG